jgi:uncharacterized protein YukE
VIVADSLNVNPDGLRAAASHMVDVGDQVKAVLSSLNSQIDALGQPWGDDSVGHQFANGDKGYLAQKDNVTAAVTSMSQFIDGLADSLKTTADSFEQVDGSS